MTNQKPSVGSIVHYRFEETCQAAIVCNSASGYEFLMVLPPNPFVSVAYLTVSHDASVAHGTWHWPDRVMTEDVKNKKLGVETDD